MCPWVWAKPGIPLLSTKDAISSFFNSPFMTARAAIILKLACRNVTCPGRSRDLRDLEFGGELVSISEGETNLLERFIDQGQ